MWGRASDWRDSAALDSGLATFSIDLGRYKWINGIYLTKLSCFFFFLFLRFQSPLTILWINNTTKIAQNVSQNASYSHSLTHHLPPSQSSSVYRGPLAAGVSGGAAGVGAP